VFHTLSSFAKIRRIPAGPAGTAAKKGKQRRSFPEKKAADAGEDFFFQLISAPL